MTGFLKRTFLILEGVLRSILSISFNTRKDLESRTGNMAYSVMTGLR